MPLPAAPAPASAPAAQPAPEPKRGLAPIPPLAKPGAAAKATAGDASPVEEGVGPRDDAAGDTLPQRDATGKFVARDHGEELAGVLFEGDSGDSVAPEDRAVTTLDGGEPEQRGVGRSVVRKSGGEALEDALLDASPVGAESSGAEAGAAGVEAQAGVLAPTTTELPPAAPEPDLTDPNVLIELVISGSPVVYKNRAHLVQAVKSLRGMYNTAEAERLALTSANHQNYAAAQAWRAQAESGAAPPASGNASPVRGQGRSAEAPAQGQDAAGRQAATAVAEATGAPEETIAAAVDWDTYNYIKKEKGAEVAQLWATARMIAAATHKTSERIEEMQRPSRELAAEFTLGEAWGKTMHAMESWTNDDGSLSYPELADDGVLEELGYVLSAFKKQGVSPEFLKTPRGMHTAILSWRDYRQAKGNPWRPANASPVSAAPSEAASTPPDSGIESAVASVVRTMRGTGNAPARPAAPRDAREYRIKEAIVSADVNPHGDFPWAP